MAGTITKGNDGIVRLDTGAELPCLTEWTLSTSTSTQQIGGRCMKSNNDDTLPSWRIISVLGRGWRILLKFAWQRTDEGAAPSFSAERVGEAINLTLFPAGVSVRAYNGIALLANIGKATEVGDLILQNVALIGDGELFELAPGALANAFITIAGDPYITIAGDPYVTI